MIVAADDESRQQHLERLLVEHARPVIASVLGRISRSDRTVSRDDIDDLASTVTLRLVRKLQAADSVDDEAIHDFENYVATLTYHTIHDFMRQRFPERTRLKNRIRYLFEHDRRLAMWKSESGMACGLSAWRGRQDVDEQFALRSTTASRAMRNSRRPHDAIVEILHHAGRPLLLDTMVGVAAVLWDVTEMQLAAPNETLGDDALSPAAVYDIRQRLAKLWRDIALLPQNHRAALLLNLRDPDGANAVALLVVLRVARLDEIARAIGMSAEELAALWDSLPLSDLEIGVRLQLTRQQVINLRRTARQRLRGGP